ncbi:hypothetical protein [Frankia sp. R82]|uniref:hypothetical protein n=1 Tax=Frankia sp. R82 TaxID=2950553 RepID=UPI0020439016|nr:hypothetical protein [Frankia sp. R82]MCM3884176.1 hypothetical protein [Frankia sp. R82]
MALTGDITDDFNDGVIGNPPWTASAFATEAGGVLTVQCVPSYGNVQTASTLDFRSSRVAVQVLGVPTGGYAAIAPVADVTATTSQLRQGSLTGPRMLLAGISLWGVQDPIVGPSPLGDQQYAARNSIAVTLRSWGVTYVRIRLWADYWNGLTSSDRAAYVAKAVGWRDALQAQGILTCFCYWDALDGTYKGAAWATNYNRAFDLMSAVANAVGVNDPWTFYEPFNEPNSVSDADWYTAMAATITYYRSTIGYKGLLLIDSNNYSHAYDDTRFTNLENLDTTLTGTGRANIAFAKHDYPDDDDATGQTFSGARWTAATGGASRRHIIIETEFGVKNGNLSDNPTWGGQAATFYAAQMQTQTNFCGAAGFLFGNWYDDNAMTAADYTTTTTWGGLFKNNFLANANGTRPANGTGQASVQISLNSTNTVETVCETQDGALALVFRLKTAGVMSDVSIPYSTTDHRWWRMTEAAGVITWATSADGLTWTTQRTAASTFSLTAVGVSLLAGYYGLGFADQGSAVYDNFNLTPTTGGGGSGPGSATWPRLIVEAGFGLPARAATTWPLSNGDTATCQRSIGQWAAYVACTVGLARGVAPAPYRNSVAITGTGGEMLAGIQTDVGSILSGVSYTATVQLRAAVTGRASTLKIDWKFAGGGTATVSGTTITTNTNGWTTLTVTSPAPTGTSYAFFYVDIPGAAAGERHYAAALTADTSTSRWTDITRYVRGKVSLQRSSRQYELGRFEAGSASIAVDNSDGRFTYGNSASPYYPNIRPIVPVRIRAVWNGVVYPRWAGVVERWPLSWQDPALSIPTITCVDSPGVLSQGELRSTYEEEVRLDNPASFIPMVEEQTSQAAGDIVQPDVAPITPSKYGGAQSDFGGAAVVFDGGSSLNLNPGGQLTACDYVDLSKAPGMVPSQATGWSMEMWIKPQQDVIPDTNSPLFSHLIAGTNLKTGYQIIISRNFDGQISFATGGTIAYNSGGTWYPEDSKTGEINAIYLCITLDTTGRSHFYINGGEEFASTNYLGPTPTAAVLGGDWYSTTSPQHLCETLVSHVAFYNYELPADRVAAHWAVGRNGGYDLERTGARVNRILNYGRWPVAMRSVQPGDSYAGSGNGFGLAGLAGQSTLGACQDTADAEAGQLYAAADGTIVFEARSYRASQTQAVNLWDGIAGLPYQLDGLGFDLDPTYIYNTVNLTRDGGPTQSATDTTSADMYLPRTYSGTLKLRDDSELAGRTNLYLSLYKNPRLRMSGFSFIPSANPSVLFPVALTIDISDRQRVVHRPIGAPAITYDGYVDALAEEITVEHGGTQEWKTDVQMSPMLVDYWQLAAARTTVSAGAGAGSTSLVLAALPDRLTNPAQASWATGAYDIWRAGARIGQVTVTAVNPTFTGYTTFTVAVTALGFGVNAGDTIVSQLPAGATSQSSPTQWDSRSILGSTTRLAN